MSSKLTAVSLFSGCGGFDWGVHEAGIEIIWANDIDVHAAAAYQAIFPKVRFVPDDVRMIHTFPEADVLIGCYPCTGFSLGARRRWHDESKRDLKADHGNFLYTEFLRALAQVKPRYLLVENVKGMVSAEKGWFFKQQLKGFRKLGYKVMAGRLEACDYGVPQSRTRIFIVGVRNDIKDFKYHFPKPSHGPKGAVAYKLLRDSIKEKQWPDDDYFEYQFHGHYLTRNRKRGWDELSYTIVADAHHVPLHPMGEPMIKVGKDQWELQGDQNRRLSWRECASIQELPEGAVPTGNLLHKYRVVGNAVPPSFGRSLITPIVEYESSL